jgi:hypothetical protein
MPFAPSCFSKSVTPPVDADALHAVAATGIRSVNPENASVILRKLRDDIVSRQSISRSLACESICRSPPYLQSEIWKQITAHYQTIWHTSPQYIVRWGASRTLVSAFAATSRPPEDATLLAPIQRNYPRAVQITKVRMFVRVGRERVFMNSTWRLKRSPNPQLSLTHSRRSERFPIGNY